MKEKINELFEKIYDKYFIEKEGSTSHLTVNGVTIYFANYRRDEDFATVQYAGILLNRNGSLNFDDYSEFINRNFDIACFVEWVEEKIFNDEITKELETTSFFRNNNQRPDPITRTIEKRSLIDIQNEGKVQILEVLLAKKITLES